MVLEVLEFGIFINGSPVKLLKTAIELNFFFFFLAKKQTNLRCRVMSMILSL